MQPQNITIHSATANTSFPTLANALAAILQEQGTRISPAVWGGEAPRQICLAPFMNDVVFDMDLNDEEPGVITQSWADLMAEVDAELAQEAEGQHQVVEQAPAPTADVGPVVLPLTDVEEELSVGIVFVIMEERLDGRNGGGYQMSWALSAVHNERWYRVLAHESASGELLELQACGLNVIGAVGRLQRDGLLEGPS